MYYFNFLSLYAFTIMNNVIIREENWFLLPYVILSKHVNFRQHTSSAGAKEYYFYNCCNILITDVLIE